MSLPAILRVNYTAAEKQQLDAYKGQRLRGAPTSVAPGFANGLEFDYKLSTAAEAAFLTGARYFLELQDYTGESISFYAFPYDPGSVSYDRPTAATFTHTINGGYIREFSSAKTHMISISGESGVAQRLIVNRRGELVYADGQRAMLELDEFLKRYHEFNSFITGEKNFITKNNEMEKRKETQRKFKTDPGLRMIFHSLDEQASFIVEPMDFSYGRSKDRYRHSYSYGLQLKSFDYYTIDYNQFTPFGVGALFDSINSALNTAAFFAALASRFLEGVDEQFIGPFRENVQNVSNMLNEYSNTLETLDRTVANAVRIASDVAHAIDAGKKLLNNVIGVFNGDLWEATRNAGNDVATDFSNITEAEDIVFRDEGEAVLAPQPEETNVAIEQQQAELRAIKNTLEKNPESLNDLVASGLINEFINGTARGVELIQAQAFYNAFLAQANLSYINDLNKRFLRQNYHHQYIRSYRHLGQYLANDESIRDFANSVNPNNTGIGGDKDALIRTINYTMREGQTLEDVARLLLGASNRWVVLAGINNWVSATRNHLNNLPAGGEVIKVPASATAISDQNPFVDFEKDDGLLGVDLRLEGNDLVFTNDDIALASGEDNIKQLIVHTVLSNKGEIPGFGVFGTPDYIGSAVANEELSLDYVNLSLRQALLADSRIVELSDVEIQLDGTKIDFSCSVVPIVGESSQVTIPIR